MQIKRMNFKLKIISASVFSAVLTGCGGGGGGGATVIPDLPEPVVITPTYYEQQTATNVLSAWEQGYKGAGVTVAVIDSGINSNHVEFQDELGNSRIDTVNATGFDYDGDFNVIQVPNYSDTASDYHGTHVASLVAGAEYGLAPEATILPVNVIQDNGVAWSDILMEAFAYAAPKARVMNASVSGMVNPVSFGSNNPYDSYLNSVSSNDTILVVAAGNDGEAIGAKHFEDNNIAKNMAIDPLAQGRIFNVVAIDSSNNVASFSNTPGSCSDVTVDADIACNETVMTEIQNTFISAPGFSIKAADGSTTDSSQYLSGTSMAAPIVSGALATILSSWDNLTSEDAAQIVRDTANDSFAGYDISQHGVGIIDVEAALSPIGTLKAASEGASASVTPSQITAKIPSSLAGIKNIQALKSAAFYDNYNRDFAIDLTNNIEVVKTPINWNAHWNQTTLNEHYSNTMKFGATNLTMAFNPSVPGSIDTLAISGSGYVMAFGQQGKGVKALDSLVKTNGFISGQSFTGNTFSGSFNLTNSVSFNSSVNWQDSYALTTDNENLSDTSTQLGLTYKASENFSIGTGVEWLNQANSLANASGETAFSFGENNLTQLGVVSANYSHGNNQFFGMFKAGNLVNSTPSKVSYLSVDNAIIGQTLLGFSSTLSKNTQLGIQAFSDLSIASAKLNLKVPTGIDSNGEMEYTNQSFNHKGDLTPNTLEMFYKFTPSKGFAYSINALSGQDDSGIGMSVESKF